MGTTTGRLFRTIRSTGRGSDYFGTCDQCGKHMSECHVSQVQREYRRDDGTTYTGPVTGGAYGHRECLVKHFGEPVPAVTRESVRVSPFTDPARFPKTLRA
jgi:hypothetical protein